MICLHPVFTCFFCRVWEWQPAPRQCHIPLQSWLRLLGSPQKQKLLELWDRRSGCDGILLGPVLRALSLWFFWGVSHAKISGSGGNFSQTGRMSHIYLPSSRPRANRITGVSPCWIHLTFETTLHLVIWVEIFPHWKYVGRPRFGSA